MKLAAIAFTKSGVEICTRLKSSIHDLDLYFKEELSPPEIEQYDPIAGSFPEFVGKLFFQYDGLIFVMATGIVVRGIAPHLENKQSDPAVVVIDDLGQHVIPLLSGHLGGANDLARQLADLLNGTPVITTSTDLHHVPAFDLIAKEYGMALEKLENLKYISGALIDGERVGLFTDLELTEDWGPLVEMGGSIEDFLVAEEIVRGELLRNWQGIVLITEKIISEEIIAQWSLPVLILRPRNIVAGVGFRRGKTAQELWEALEKACTQAQVSFQSIGKIATIDLKGDEPGLDTLSGQLAVPVEIFPKEKIAFVEELFPTSRFVKKSIGVGCVADPSAYLAAVDGEWVMQKQGVHGVTVALRRVNTLTKGGSA